MEFLHSKFDDKTSTVDALRVNWFYRPRDVQRYATDIRQVYGTMHSDICPLTSLRGKVTIRHRSEIEDLDAFRKQRDSFWFNQIYDRFIHRYFEVIPVSQIINVPDKVKKALDEWWKYVAVEITRVKELTSAVKTCKRCSGYCARYSARCPSKGRTLTASKQRLRRLCIVQEHISPELRATAIAEEAVAGICMGLRAMWQGPREEACREEHPNRY